jgi:hypothetical protein
MQVGKTCEFVEEIRKTVTTKFTAIGSALAVAHLFGVQRFILKHESVFIIQEIT